MASAKGVFMSLLLFRASLVFFDPNLTPVVKSRELEKILRSEAPIPGVIPKLLRRVPASVCRGSTTISSQNFPTFIEPSVRGAEILRFSDDVPLQEVFWLLLKDGRRPGFAAETILFLAENAKDIPAAIPMIHGFGQIDLSSISDLGLARYVTLCSPSPQKNEPAWRISPCFFSPFSGDRYCICFPMTDEEKEVRDARG